MTRYLDVALALGWGVAGFASLVFAWAGAVLLREHRAASHGGSSALDRRSGPPGRRAYDRGA
jgi:hypothetical protein